VKLSFFLVTPILSLAFASSTYAQDPSWPLTLLEAQSLARERNYDLNLARSAIEGAKANVLIAGAAPNPILTIATNSINTTNGGGSGHLWNRSIDSIARIDQLIERGGKRELRQENAQTLMQAVQSDVVDTERQLGLIVAQAYIDVKAAQEKHAAILETSRLMESMLAAAQLRKSAGDIAGSDVERVRVDALRSQNELASAKGELAVARRTLVLILGLTEHMDNLEAVDPWAELIGPEPLSESRFKDIIAQRPDVRAAMARVDAAEAGNRLAQSLRTRDVSVGMQYEHYPQPGDALHGNGSSVGFSVQVPLFTNYYYKGEILAAQAARTASEQSLLRARAIAENEIRLAWSTLSSAAERVRRNRDELLLAAEKAANAAEFAYKNGAVGIMDVLDARRTLRATRLDALAAQVEFSKASATWQAATAITQEFR
jgi:cobalt-zinc-cadmium efflux system outer membrane protein